MKPIKLLTAAALGCSFFFTACKKESTNGMALVATQAQNSATTTVNYKTDGHQRMEGPIYWKKGTMQVKNITFSANYMRVLQAAATTTGTAAKTGMYPVSSDNSQRIG